MNYLQGNISEAIFRVGSGPCFDAHAQVNYFDFSISSKVNMVFLPFLPAINTKCLQNFKFQAISKSRFKTDVVTDIRSNITVQNAQ